MIISSTFTVQISLKMDFLKLLVFVRLVYCKTIAQKDTNLIDYRYTYQEFKVSNYKKLKFFKLTRVFLSFC